MEEARLNNDKSMAPVLVESMRYQSTTNAREASADVLRELTGSSTAGMTGSSGWSGLASAARTTRPGAISGIDALRHDRVVNDSVGGADLVVVASSLSADALAFRSEGRQFSLPDDALESLPDMLLDEDGAVWHVERDRLWKDDDPAQTLSLHPANVSFWFGWYVTHPDTLLYGATEG